MNTHPVDEPGGDGAHADVAARLHATLAAPVMDAGVRQRHLQAIRDRAASLPAPAPAYAPAARAYAPAPAPAGGGWARRLASSVTAAGLVVVMGASGAVAASHQTLPGHALYPVKEVTERLVLAAGLPTGLAVDRHLTFAERRLDEAAALVDRDGDAALVAEAIAEHTRLIQRADALAADDRELTGRVDAAALVARGRLAHLLDEGLPEVAADQARAALAAAEERLVPSPTAPPATPPARPAPPTHPADPGAVEPDPPSPAPPAPTPPAGTPGHRAPAPPGTPAQPGEPANPGPSDQPDERRPPSRSSSQPATPRQQRPPRDPEGAQSGPADNTAAPSNRQLVPDHDRLRLGH